MIRVSACCRHPAPTQKRISASERPEYLAHGSCRVEDTSRNMSIPALKRDEYLRPTPASARPVMAWIPREKLALIACDLLALTVAFTLGWLASWWWSGASPAPAQFLWRQHSLIARFFVFGGLAATAVLWFWNLGHYSQRKPFWDELAETWRVLLVMAALDMVLLFLGKWNISRIWVLGTWFSALLAIPALRLWMKQRLMRSGAWMRPTVVLGVGKHAQDTAAALRSEPYLGFSVVAFLAPPGINRILPEHIELADRCVPVLALGDQPEQVLDSIPHAHMVVALDGQELQKHQRMLQRLNLRYQNLNIVPPISGIPILGTEITHFYSHEVMMLRVRNNLGRRGSQILKRVFDVIVAGALLLTLSPLFAVFIYRIRQNGGSAIFGHERVGQRGKPFTCYKFRTMVCNADAVLHQLLSDCESSRAEWQRDFKLRNDPRITPIGAFLRKTSLDELPQLWNVLRGDMSLVGPRPVITAELGKYGDEVTYYLEARPGMTGLWQVSGRNNVDYSHRVYLDSWYVKNWTLWVDIVILIKTVRVVLGRDGAY